jgi:hypothetical protein
VSEGVGVVFTVALTGACFTGADFAAGGGTEGAGLKFFQAKNPPPASTIKSTNLSKPDPEPLRRSGTRGADTGAAASADPAFDPPAGGAFFGAPAGAITGKSGGAFTTTPPSITGVGVATGAGANAAASITGGGAKTNGGAPAFDSDGGVAGLNDFGLSLNFPLSAPGAGADDIAGEEGASDVNNAGALTGAGGVAKSGGEGAITCGFAIASGGITAGKLSGAASGAVLAPV